MLVFKINGYLNVGQVIVRMINLANSTGNKVLFNFNGVRLLVKPGDGSRTIYEFYSNEIALFPNTTDASWTGMEECVKTSPFSIVNSSDWEKYKINKQYDARLVEFIVRWVSLMEKEIGKGESIGDIAHKTANDANIECGELNVMCEEAVLVLSHIWKYGRKLFHECRRKQW